MTEENNKLSNEELNHVITEMLGRVGKVADLVEQVFPDKGLGLGIRDSVDKLKGHVQTLANRSMPDDLIPIEDLLTDTKLDITTLDEIALKDCIDSFKHRAKLIENNDPTTVKTLELVSQHARELYASIHYARSTNKKAEEVK
jgi:hypothetical protein